MGFGFLAAHFRCDRYIARRWVFAVLFAAVPLTADAVDLYAVTRIPLLPNATTCSATAMSEHGQVVGSCFLNPLTCACSQPEDGFIWDSAAGTRSLRALTGISALRGVAVNSGGQVIAVSSSFTKSYFWDPLSGTTEIAPLPGDTEVRALGLNNLGEVVGDSGPATSGIRFAGTRSRERGR
jgi:hypothetical protein